MAVMAEIISECLPIERLLSAHLLGMHAWWQDVLRVIAMQARSSATLGAADIHRQLADDVRLRRGGLRQQPGGTIGLGRIST